MLLNLYIENIAVIEQVSMEFDAGFYVLTGETGAGKSIIIDALNTVLGEKVSRDAVRTGASSASVSAVFGAFSPETVQALLGLGLVPDEDGLLLIQRQVYADGRSGSVRINGKPTTVALLRQAGRLLVNVHGQHENQALLSPERHMDYLDRVGGLMPMREDYRKHYKEYAALRSELANADMDEAAKARAIDILRYQINEIEEAKLVDGEEEELRAKRALFRNAERIAAHLQSARQALSGGEDDSGAVARCITAAGELQQAGRYMEEAERLSGRLEELLIELRDCAEEAEEMGRGLDFDERERDAVERRLDVLQRLSVKYGEDTRRMLEYLGKCRQDLDAIETSDQHIRQLTVQMEQARETATLSAAALTKARETAARKFAEKVREHLSYLDMPGVTMEVLIGQTTLGERGADTVEFLISANPGESPKSIAKIASGGELSRIMLAIQSVLADIDDIDTLVFDEIDTGISGKAAVKVGIKLAQTAKGSAGTRRRQVLCVTHLAQIAAAADTHMLIEKSVDNDKGRTFTHVTELSFEKRLQELARIISGSVTPAGLAAAKEMLRK